MTRTNFFSTAAAACLMCSSLIAGSTYAADINDTANASVHTSHVRASQLTGMEVVNATGKAIGKVNDVVLDVQTGNIRYAAVSYGGLLGIGDKLFAVPWKAFAVKYDENGKKHALMLDVSEVDLKNATGFDQDHWPDFADRKFTDTVDQTYHGRLRGGRVNVDVNGGKVNVDVDRK